MRSFVAISRNAFFVHITGNKEDLRMKSALSKSGKLGNLLLIVLHLSAWIILGTTAIYRKDYSIFGEAGRSIVILGSFGYVAALMILLINDSYFLWRNPAMRLFFFICSLLLMSGVLLHVL